MSSVFETLNVVRNSMDDIVDIRDGEFIELRQVELHHQYDNMYNSRDQKRAHRERNPHQNSYDYQIGKMIYDKNRKNKVTPRHLSKTLARYHLKKLKPLYYPSTGELIDESQRQPVDDDVESLDTFDEMLNIELLPQPEVNFDTKNLKSRNFQFPTTPEFIEKVRRINVMKDEVNTTDYVGYVVYKKSENFYILESPM